jgi:hypothetical protein
MLQEFEAKNEVDADGNPAGGHVYSRGVKIVWQNGPLGRGANRAEANGAFVETVIAEVKQRIEFYQRSKFACVENGIAIQHLSDALVALQERTRTRDARGVEGTHAI